MHRTGKPLAALAVLVVLALGGCASLLPQRHDEVQRELNRQRALWRSQGLASYEYVVRRVCFCPPPIVNPVRVRVRDGQVTTRAYTDSGEAPDPQQARLWPTVEGLFDLVQDAIDRDAHSISVDYHPQLGYPVRAHLDYHVNMADEEQGFTAGELVPVVGNR